MLLLCRRGYRVNDHDMDIKDLLKQSRTIWGEERLSLSQIIVRLGVIVGDLCRWERNADKDEATRNDTELKKELGNVIFSTVRWCDDLGFDPEECIELSMKSQEKFASENTRH